MTDPELVTLLAPTSVPVGSGVMTPALKNAKRSHSILLVTVTDDPLDVEFPADGKLSVWLGTGYKADELFDSASVLEIEKADLADRKTFKARITEPLMDFLDYRWLVEGSGPIKFGVKLVFVPAVN